MSGRWRSIRSGRLSWLFIYAWVGLSMAILVELGCAPAGALAATNPCEVQTPSPSPPPTATALRVQGDIGPDFEGQVEATFGSQYGGLWFGKHGETLSIGLTAGLMTSDAATEAVDVLLRADVGAGDLALVESNTQVIAVPYSPVQLDTDQDRLHAQLLAAIPSDSFSIGQGISESGGAGSGSWLRIDVWLNRNASDTDCASALAIVQTYGSEASLVRTNETLPVPDVGIGSAPVAMPPAGVAPQLTLKGRSPGVMHHAKAPIHRRGRGGRASSCRFPRLSGLVLSVARKRAANAGCKVRLMGAHLEQPAVQTVDRQSPRAGGHGRVVTIWVNPLCSGSAAWGPPGGEPSLVAGPTELVSGLYLDGGPHRLRSARSCDSLSGTPGAGTITVTNPATGVTVATQTVSEGHLATIPLSPGTYQVTGTFGQATLNGRPGERSQTVQIPRGKTVRDDIVLNIK